MRSHVQGLKDVPTGDQKEEMGSTKAAAAQHVPQLWARLALVQRNLQPQQDIWLGVSGFIGIHSDWHDVLTCSRRLHQVICSSSWEAKRFARAETKQNAKPPRAKALNDICWYCSQQLCFQHSVVWFHFSTAPCFVCFGPCHHMSQQLFHAVAHTRPRGRRMQVLEERMELKASAVGFFGIQNKIQNDAHSH